MIRAIPQGESIFLFSSENEKFLIKNPDFKNEFPKKNFCFGAFFMIANAFALPHPLIHYSGSPRGKLGY